MRPLRWLVCLAAAVAIAAARPGPSSAATPEATKLDAALRWALADPGQLEAASGAPAERQAPTLLPVLVRFHRPPQPSQLESLEGDGLLRWRRAEGRVLGATTVFLARLAPEAAGRLAARAEVARVELDWRVGGRPPLDVTAPLSGADRAWAQLDDGGRPLTGAGVVVADLDSGVDPTHPALLQRETTPLAWHDDDGGGFSGSGGEWVDLDGDGVRGAGETLRFLSASTPSSYPPGNPAGYTAGLDWLYADVDGNGVRDAAPLDGWGETSPSLGEPLLVSGDPDGDGLLDPGEPLFLLGQPKLRAVRGPDGTVYRRGESLLQAPLDSWVHGTSVCGILAGGEPGFTRLAGFAPGAELVLAMIEWANEPRFWTTLAELATWAVSEGADLILVEDGEWVWEFMDGSSAEELLLSELARDQGVVVLVAAGNLAGGGQHDRRSAPAGGAATFSLLVDPGADPIHTLWLNLNWRGGRDQLSWRVEGPMGSFSGPVPDEPQQLTLPGGTLAVLGDTSAAGTQMLAFRLQAEPQIASGTWLFALDNAGAAATTVDAFKLDDLSGWGGVSVFLDASDEGSVTWPATAPDVIVVGAYSGRPGFGTPQGRLNSFSGRGPSLDGRRLVDICAPGSATFSAGDGRSAGSLGPWSRFGGTSAALPHVAGTVALLLQAEPAATPLQVERALERGALADRETGAVPNPSWGYGKLDAAAALAALRQILAEEAAVEGEPGPPRRPPGRMGSPEP